LIDANLKLLPAIIYILTSQDSPLAPLGTLFSDINISLGSIGPISTRLKCDGTYEAHALWGNWTA